MIRCVAFDFDGVFTDNAVYVLQDGTEMVRCTRADGLGLQQLRAKGLKLVVISTERNPIVSARCAKLGVECLQDSANKVLTLERFLKDSGISFAETAFLGNDINDSEILTMVGFPAVVADAHPEVVPLAKHRTSRSGGHGAVREFSEFLLSSGLLETEPRNEPTILAER
jgi:3-deoxy-D-manno-octulosonate 8-phosphate phosphatase (KDO 8-P phosphatase)